METTTTIEIVGKKFTITDEKSESVLQAIAQDANKRIDRNIGGGPDEARLDTYSALALTVYELEYELHMLTERYRALDKTVMQLKSGSGATTTSTTGKRSYNGKKNSSVGQAAEAVTAPGPTENKN